MAKHDKKADDDDAPRVSPLIEACVDKYHCEESQEAHPLILGKQPRVAPKERMQHVRHLARGNRAVGDGCRAGRGRGEQPLTDHGSV